MAVLTASGITFGGGDSLNSRYGIIPQLTPMIFLRSSAPTFWTQVTTQNNKALRVISGAGGNAGGVNDFTSTFNIRNISANVPVTINGLTAGAVGLSINQIAVHAHGLNAGGNTGGGPASPSTGIVNGAAPGGSTGNAGNSSAHGHNLTYSAANGPGSVNLDFRVTYADCIICTFN